jgi:hypothetical protein
LVILPFLIDLLCKNYFSRRYEGVEKFFEECPYYSMAHAILEP